MQTKNENILSVIFIFLLTGCSALPMSTASQAHLLEFPERTLQEWEPSHAIEEAKRDIANGNPKIYLSGTLAPYAPGIRVEQYDLIKHLPRADAGAGCIIKNEEVKFRDIQAKYAERYNLYILNYLLKAD